MSKEPLTYITYNEGLEAKHLHLGMRFPLMLSPHVREEARGLKTCFMRCPGN